MLKSSSQYVKAYTVIVLIIVLCIPQLSVAQNKVSMQEGNWHNVTWNPANLPGPSNNVTLSHSLIIEKDSVVHINNLDIGQNGDINVNGTLIVNGNIEMENNGSSFKMGGSAKVIIFGDFLASNKVDVSISSYLIIHGDFIKKGSSGQGDFDVENGNIYIYGNVNGWPEFGDCGTGEDYDGTPAKDGNCDYGTEEDFINNPDIPGDLIELSNCYDLSSVSDQQVCEGQTAILSISEIQGVNYQWQKKTSGADWEPVGSNGNTHDIKNVSFINNGDQYRVIVMPIDSQNSTCKIGISKSVSLFVNSAGIWTGTADTSWNNPANWSCNSLPTLQTNVLIPAEVTHYPVISTGDNAQAKDLEIEAGASIRVTNNWLRIGGNLSNSGSFNATAGSISFEGSMPQIIPDNAFVNSTIRNLNIKNPEGVYSQGRIKVLNSLKVEEGILETGNDLTLVSDASGTAFIDGTGNGTISGNVNMQRYLSNAFGYKYFSTPFQNTSVDELASNFELTDPETGFPHLYEYVEGRKDSSGNDLTGWQKYLEPTATLNPGAGYAINPGGQTNAMTLELTGEVNDGTITVELQNNNGTFTNGFNLVGNPYPSPIDWDKISLDGLDDAIYFFRSDNEDRYTGTYSSSVNGVSTGVTSTIVPSMQGFFVRVSDPEDGNYPAKASLTFTNAVRTGNEVKQEYYKSKNKPEVPTMRFSASFKGTKGFDAMVLYFKNGATADFENKLDAQKMLNTAVNVPSFYSLSSKGQKLSINAIPRIPSEELEIPLGISAERSGEIVLSLLETTNVFPSHHIYLKDKKRKLLQDLNEDPEYNFTAQKGEINDRFSLILSSKKLFESDLKSSLDPFSVQINQGEILVKLKLSENTSANVILSSISGQVLQQKPGKGNDEIKFSGSLITGIYLVTLETEKETRTKKVIYKN